MTKLDPSLCAEATLARHWRAAILRQLALEESQGSLDATNDSLREARFQAFVARTEKAMQPAPGSCPPSLQSPAVGILSRLRGWWLEGSNSHRWSLAASVAGVCMLLAVLMRNDPAFEDTQYRGDMPGVQQIVALDAEQTLAELEAALTPFGAKTRRVALPQGWRLEAKVPETALGDTEKALQAWSIKVPANGILILDVTPKR